MEKNMCKTKKWQFRSHKERVESLLKSKNGPPIRTAHYFCHHQVYVHYLPSNTSSFSTQSSNLCFFKLGTLSTLNYLDFTSSHCTPGTSKTNTDLIYLHYKLTLFLHGLSFLPYRQMSPQCTLPAAFDKDNHDYSYFPPGAVRPFAFTAFRLTFLDWKTFDFAISDSKIS